MWNSQLVNPSNERRTKPRSQGLTMVMDKGLGLHAFKDLVETGSSYIDFIKLGFGTAGITPISILKEKLSLSKKFNIPIYPGGTFFEVAKTKNLLRSYFQNVLEIGFEWVEISDGSITLSSEERKSSILLAQHHGLNVLTEIGKKIEDNPTSFSSFRTAYEQDIDCGSRFVIVEGREHGENLNVFDHNGELDTRYIAKITESIGSSHLIWEAPQKYQQIQLLKAIGNDVNFGNISPYEILSVEALRRGLRSDSLLHNYETPL